MAAPKKDPAKKLSCNRSYKVTPGEAQALDAICEKLRISKGDLVRWFLPSCNGGVFKRGYPGKKRR